MAITKMAMLVAVVVGLLAMVQQSSQMRDYTSSRLRETGNDLSSWAVIVSRKTSERTILDSGDFVLTGSEVIAGRVFNTGILNGQSVVLVNSGKYSTNVASALQIVLAYYRIRGVLYLGLAGGLIGGKGVLNVGEVIIPRSVAFISIWDWLPLNANPEGELVFGNFNGGENLQNSLGSVKFNNASLYTGHNNVSSLFFLDTDPQWVAISEIVKKNLYPISIHTRFTCASSDMKINNPAYASFITKRFKFPAVDQESATIALISKSNDVPYMVFQGASNIIPTGLPATEVGKRKAAKNAYAALKAFMGLIPQPRGHLTARQ